MKTDLLISISVAAVSHAVALFAFNDPGASPDGEPELLYTIDCILPPIPQVEPLEPESIEDEIVDFTETASDSASGDSFEPAVSTAATGPSNPVFASENTIQVPIGETHIGLPPGEGLGSRGSVAIPGLGSLDETPKALAQIPPRYPHDMRRSGVDGRVEVRFVVGPDGRVQSAEAIEFSHRAFAEAAMAAVRKWRFEPGRRNGRRVSFRMTLPVVFSVTNS